MAFGRLPAKLACIGCVALAVIKLVSSQCVPLCKFDSDRTEECHVSREYAAEVIKFYDDGIWGKLVAQHAECEARTMDCGGMWTCEIDGTGTCAARRSWVVENLAKAEAEGGAGLNSDRCGIFGRLLVDGASCLPNADKTSCSNAVGASSGIPCAWDTLRGVCEASRKDILFILRRDYRDELARVSLRRERCRVRESTIASCAGDCQLVNGTCTLRTVDALLAVAGEDCPVSTLLRQNAGCWNLEDEESCTARKRSDSLKECDWRRGQCEAHPVALEFDLLLMLGLGQSEILEPIEAAQTKCSQFWYAEACDAECAPLVGPRSAAVLQRPWLVMAVLLITGVERLRGMI